MHKGHKKDELTKAEVAKRFNVDVATVNRWLHAGYFPNAYKISPGLTSPYRIPQTDIDNFDRKRRETVKR